MSYRVFSGGDLGAVVKEKEREQTTGESNVVQHYTWLWVFKGTKDTKIICKSFTWEQEDKCGSINNVKGSNLDDRISMFSLSWVFHNSVIQQN